MMENKSLLYMHSGKIPLASKLSFYVRRKIFKLFMHIVRPAPDTSVLDLGVTSDSIHPESNYFESFYPYHQRLTCAGTEDGSHLEEKFPGVRYIRVTAGQKLPFKDREFDVVFSSAVVEHTGSNAGQRFFIREICRVGRLFFITTPNRWFPVEMHTGLPLLHYLPQSWFRKLLRGTRYDFWSREENLNLLTARNLQNLFPAAASPRLAKVKILGIPSNLVAYGVCGDTVDGRSPWT